MSSNQRWLNFRYKYIDTTWFDCDRAKTFAAMRKLCEQAPCDVLDKLPRLSVFAPSLGYLGGVSTFGTGDRIFVYLAPHLETASQREVDFTVAHEFAHVALGHYKPYKRGRPSSSLMRRRERTDEQAADRLASSWGFDRPKGRRR